MKTITAGLETHIEGEVTSLCTIWEITRTDGTIFYFTDHDVSFDFEGNTYLSSVGYDASAVDNNAGLAVDNLNTRGFLDSTALREDELRAGLFDFAEVRIGVINWKDKSQGRLRMRRGWLGEVLYSEVTGTFETELRGLTQLYSQGAVELYQAECRADLGDSRCKIDLFPDVVQGETDYALEAKVRGSPDLDDEVEATLLLPLDDDTDDISRNAAEASSLGSEAAVQQTTFQRGTGALELSPTATVDPSAAFVNYSPISAYDIDTKPFTIEAWVRWKNLASPGNLQVIASHFLNTGNERAWLLRWNGSVPAIDFQIWSNGSTLEVNTQSASFTPTVGTWYHIAVSRDASGDIRIFIDGTQSGTGATYTGTVHFSSDPVRLGKIRNSGGSDQPLNGFIDDFRMTVGEALYTGSFTPPASALVSVVGVRSALTSEDYEDVFYEVTTAGRTDAQYPDFDPTPGNTTVWGTVTFTAREAFTRAFTVTGVADNSNFSITFPNGNDSREVDDWFKYGAVVWRTGTNGDVNLAMEVKSSTAPVTTGSTQLDVSDSDTFSRPAGSFLDDGFAVGMTINTANFANGANNGTFTVSAVTATTLDVEEGGLVAETGSGDETMTSDTLLELFLPMPFDVSASDTGEIYAGCDKRLTTCISKFDNVVNFRGEPYIPGMDEYLDYPDAR